jgi:2-oxoisovalerate dehydrogenase E1 component alpha subunit
VTVDGTDPLAVYDEVKKASERARTGQGPSLIESKFYRLSAHGNAITVPPVPTQFPKHEAVEVYGRKAEYEAARANDPITKFRSKLIAAAAMTEANAIGIEEKVQAEMDEAVRFGLASPHPAPEDALKNVYA